jgi:hypothetical protein
MLTVAVGLVGLRPPVVAAQTVQTVHVVGAEMAATNTRGAFVGVASGALAGSWSAVVMHAPLAYGVSGTTAITGGVFRLYTVQHHRLATLTGTFTGGTITTLNPGPNCSEQVYAVLGTLGGVSVGNQSGGSGTFRAVLTHYRTALFGRCVTFSAAISPGTVSLTFF